VWFESYVATLVQSDLRDLANLEHLAETPRLLAMLASGFNHADLARSMKFPQSTLRRYVGLLEALFLIRSLPAWSSSRGKRLVKSPKLMFPDAGLLAHLTGLRELSEIAGKKFVRGVVLHLGREPVPFVESLHALPLPCLWQSD
jgi:predicted AAA+ superfamily ATPase